MANRREFLKCTLAAGLAAGTRTLWASDKRRVFFAGFSHETNTFHPVRTESFGFGQVGRTPPAVWEDPGLTVIAGDHARPNGGGTIEEKPCREAMNRILDSLRAAMPVDAVFLRLHGAMYAEGIGPAETVLVGEVRSIVGPKVPIACTFDLHGNMPGPHGPVRRHSRRPQDRPAHGWGPDRRSGRPHSAGHARGQGASGLLRAADPDDPARREGDDDLGAFPVARRGSSADRAGRRARPPGEDSGGDALCRLRLDRFARHRHVRDRHRRRLAGQLPGPPRCIWLARYGTPAASSHTAAKLRNWRTASARPWRRRNRPSSSPTAATTSRPARRATCRSCCAIWSRGRPRAPSSPGSTIRRR